MEIVKVIGIAAIAGIAGITVFHLCHYELYCQYKKDPSKSHCTVCGHRKVCQKYHSGK